MKEFDLILFLMKNPGKVYSRGAVDLVWGYDYQGDTRTVVCIPACAKSLNSIPPGRNTSSPSGEGYYFAD